MRRGQIWLADLGELVGDEQGLERPVALLSAQPWLDSRPSVVVVIPLTRTRRNRRTQVEIELGISGLRATSYAECDDLRAVSPRRLKHHFGWVDDVALSAIEGITRRLLAV